MLSVSESVELNAPAEAVWNTVGDFGAAQRYLAVVERCDLSHHGSSTERLLHLKGGGSVRERLVLSNDEDRSLRYTIVESPLPVADYVSTVRVDPVDDARCRVTWASTFEPRDSSDAEAREAITGIYRMGFDGLRQLHETA
ncbi:MAG TPA: SRPBCC family protein [Dyella sp.]|nr:SRPBCC family protein [Dyella sp.]